MRCPECGSRMQKLGNVPIRNGRRFSYRTRLMCPVCCVSNKRPFKPLVGMGGIRFPKENGNRLKGKNNGSLAAIPGFTPLGRQKETPNDY